MLMRSVEQDCQNVQPRIAPSATMKCAFPPPGAAKSFLDDRAYPPGCAPKDSLIMSREKDVFLDV